MIPSFLYIFELFSGLSQIPPAWRFDPTRDFFLYLLFFLSYLSFHFLFFVAICSPKSWYFELMHKSNDYNISKNILSFQNFRILSTL